jgi:hypothetical protein
MQESSGAQSCPSWPSSALSSRSTGTPTSPMPQTSPPCRCLSALRACSSCSIVKSAHHKLRSYSFIGNSVMVPPRKYFTFCTFTVSPPISDLPIFYTFHRNYTVTQTYPLARGHVHITHADDVSAPVDFAPGYFESSVLLLAPPLT